MPEPVRPRNPRPVVRAVPGRRQVFRLAAVVGAGGLLAGCGSIRVGQPDPYTPPPPGIDDLYLADLLESLDAALELARVGLTGPEAASGAAADIAGTLAQQRPALLTGAEAEQEESSPSSSGTPSSTGSPGSAQDLVTALTQLRDLTVSASRQCSGALARPVIAIGAHTTWTMQRLAAAAGLPAPEQPPAARDITAERSVPQSDLPSIGAPEDYATLLGRLQEDEWFAGFALEVLAARADGKRRTALLDRVEEHRDRAAALGRMAQKAGDPVIPQEATYPLDEKLMAEGEHRVSAVVTERLLEGHVALVGAAPFEQRPMPIAAALQAAVRLAPLQGRLDPLPSLETAVD